LVISSGILVAFETNNIQFVDGAGFCYVSEHQDAGDNSSYSLLFHEVNFTFLYWYWPLHEEIDNNTVYVAEQRVQVFVSVQTLDGFSQILQIEIDSSSSCILDPDPTLVTHQANHTSPVFGIATANTEELHDAWVYFVGI
jgi:hypothetical protein